MAKTLLTNISLDIAGTYTNTPTGQTAATQSPLKSLRLALANGTGASQSDKIFESTGRSLAGGASEFFDLNGTDDEASAVMLTDIFGEELALLRVKMLAIYNTSTTKVLTIGAQTLRAWSIWAGGATHTVNVRPGGLLLLYAPDATAWPVVNLTTDILRVTNDAGAACTYDIMIVGASA